jgi:cell division protein DivIC
MQPFFKRLRQWARFRFYRLTPFIRNKYVLAALIFFVWLGFIDENSLLDRLRLQNEYRQLKQDKEYYNKKIMQDSYLMEELDSDEKLETAARENYLMKKDNEDIFIIQMD